MKKKLSLFLAAALLLPILLLTGCQGGKSLPEGMDEDSVLEAAETLRAELDAGDYQSVADAFRPDMKEAYSVDADLVKKVMETADHTGAYVRTADSTVAKGSSKSFDEPYAVAVLYCEHEEKDVIYEFSFDTQLALIGLNVLPKK